jgi:3-oxoacyl-[acyl-carrier-protein] synthase III
MSNTYQSYLLRPFFEPLGTKTSNEDVLTLLKGSLDPHIALRYMISSGSLYRYLDYDPIPIVPTAARAISIVLEDNHIALDRLEGIIYASFIRENLEPSTAAFIARELGSPMLKTLDVSTACSGMAHAVEVASGWLACNSSLNNIALVSVDTPFRFIDWEINVEEELVIKGPGLTIGAGVSALIVSRMEPEFGIGLRHFVSYDDASCAPECTLPANGVFHSNSNRLVRPTIQSLLKVKASGLDHDAWVLPHQPNVQVSRFSRILDVNKDRIIITHSKYGNTVSSAWVSAYYHLLKTRFDEVQTEDQVLIKTMAGGFSSLGILGNFVKKTGGAACPNC